ncbi:MAG TPA: hypothetical protein VJT78_06835 [Candidatus Dormibacteraeota bacterium]|nr:hypothetical protein [Candidatus Dormibacteraeota bacterium]
MNSFGRAVRRWLAGPAVGLLALATAGCVQPFNLGAPTTRALQSGAAGSLDGSSSFELAGTYSQSSKAWTIDLKQLRGEGRHVTVSSADASLEAVVVGDKAYFRGQQFLSQHMGTDPLSRSLVRAAGSAWWKGDAGTLPAMPDFTDGTRMEAAFLGPVVTQRFDHLSEGGVAAVNLSGPRADVFIAADPPYRLLRVHLKQGAAIDGVIDADLRYSNFGTAFSIAAPTDVIDFSNLTTLPPIYTVVAVDTTRCASPCVVGAMLKNLGGMNGAKAPSTVTFNMTDSASGQALGSCSSVVAPDVGYNATTTVACTISAASANSAIVTATPDNPGRG